MALVIRTQRYGQKKRPFYRIVVTEKANRRDGRFLEILGTYNPLVDPAAVTLKEDRVRHWVGEGAKASELCASLIKKNIPNLLEEREKAQREKIIARRKARKEKLKAKKAA